jgi:hypothetical protein
LTEGGFVDLDREGNGRDVPFGQRMFESPFLLLLLGIATMAVFYTLWGLVSILTMPQAPLP